MIHVIRLNSSLTLINDCADYYLFTQNLITSETFKISIGLDHWLNDVKRPQYGHN